MRELLYTIELPSTSKLNSSSKYTAVNSKYTAVLFDLALLITSAVVDSPEILFFFMQRGTKEESSFSLEMLIKICTSCRDIIKNVL